MKLNTPHFKASLIVWKQVLYIFLRQKCLFFCEMFFFFKVVIVGSLRIFSWHNIKFTTLCQHPLFVFVFFCLVFLILLPCKLKVWKLLASRICIFSGTRKKKLSLFPSPDLSVLGEESLSAVPLHETSNHSIPHYYPAKCREAAW